MGKLNYNERSWAIDIISEINRWAQNKNVIIKRAGGENSLKNDSNIYFPDVLLYGDENSGLIIQGWELKMPDTAIDDNKLIDNAKIKADILGLNSFLVWNVNEAALYEIKDKDLNIIKTWRIKNIIKSRKDVLYYSKEWKEMLYEILADLNYFFQIGKISALSVIDSITGEGLSKLILSHTNLVASNLKKAVQIDINLLDDITIWWETVESEYIRYNEPYIPLARLVLISWMNKLIFINLLKKYQNYAYNIDNIMGDIEIKEAINIIDEISNNCDFKNILKKQIGEEYLPEITWNYIKQLNVFLVQTRIEKIEQEAIKNILSAIVKKSSRKVSGQFSTPDILAKFLVRLVILDKTKNIFDPCCGTGTIPKASYDFMISHGVNGRDAISNIWASDKFTFPLQFAMLSLTQPEYINEVIKIFSADVVDLKLNKCIKLCNPQNGENLNLKLPKMQYILSNLPFVKQEIFKKMNSNIKNINSKIELITGQKLQGKSDLYAYIPFTLYDLLTDDGTLGIIVSNSWLGSEWGETFYKCLKYFFNIDMIITSGKGRWFKNVEVVTNILILNKKNKENEKNCTSYITMNIDLNTNEFENNVDKICSFIRKNEKCRYFDKVVYTQEQELKFLKMGVSKNTLFSDINWLLDIEDKLIKANKIFTIARGERRGWDPLFYPNKNNKIEKEYIKKVVKSSREIFGYVTEAKSDAFCCDKSIEELKKLNHINTIKWIKKFENQVNGVGKLLPEVLKRNNMKWYTMSSNSMADICITMNPGERLFFSRLKEPSFVNQRLIRFLKKDNEIDIKLCSALLNSIIGLFYIESLGFGRGQGALDLNATNVKNKLFMLDPSILSKEESEKIIGKFQKLEKREVLNLCDELKQDDRKDFDMTVLSAYKIEHLYDKIYNSLINLYSRRLCSRK